MGWLERILILALCAIIGWFHVWTVRSSGDAWKFGREQKDYYNLLIDGWLDGQLHMKVEVPRELLALKDPYDPNLRPPDLGLHDASFYNGKYYLYFGAGPVVVLMLPFRLITGVDLPQPAAELIFVYGGFLAAVGIWLGVRRRYFPETGLVPTLGGIAVLGIAGLGPMLLRRPHVWELPIGAGYCFAMLTLLFIWRSLQAERRRGWWFAAAGLALGLAVSSRPTYLIASPLLAAPLIAWWRADRRVPWRLALCAAAPMAFVGAMMAWHNYARFGDPLQMGQAYQFSLDYESKVTHFSARYVPFNTWRYFFSAAQWSPYFPFIQPADLPPKPPGFAGHDDVYGVLRNMPIAWFALLAPLALWRRASAERNLIGALLGSTTLLFVAMAGVLLFFFGSLARYQCDFTPALMLLACVGVLALERWLQLARPVVLRPIARGIWITTAAMSVVFAALFSIQLDGLIGERSPRDARAVAQLLNRIPAAFEPLLGVKHGAVELDVRLQTRASGEQILLTVGDAPRISRVFVRHLDPERVQIGFAQGGTPAILSRPLEWDFARTHGLRVTLGSLFPPRTHPFFGDRDAADVLHLTQLVRIEVDSEMLIDARRRFDGETRTVRIGRDAAVKEPALQFDGELSAVRRVAAENVIADLQREGGFLRLRVSFPPRPPTPREPLFAIGSATEGGVVFVHYLDDSGRLAFGTSARGERGEESGPLVVDLKKVHELVARWEPAGDAGRRRLQLRLGGTIVWSREVPWAARDGAIVAGRNPHGEPGCAAEFTGRTHSVQRSPDGRDPLIGPGDTLRLRVQFAPGRAGEREPLIVTGRTGAGDLVMVEYLDGQKLRFALDHWGSALIASEPLVVDFTRPHDLDISLSSLAAPPDASLERHMRRGRVRVVLDGAPVWEQESELFTIDAAEFAIGRDPIGGTGCKPEFAGDILAAERVLP